MKNLHLAVIVAVCVWTNVIDCKTQRLNQQVKKAIAHLKPTKGPKSLLDTFKSLPNDDFEFIKQLDKQFNEYGNNIKIKIQKENRTKISSNKNIKRTIDGSLGYAYQNPHQNDQQMMYTFSKPKYEIYPYSQHDIPPSPEYQQRQHHLHYLRNYPTALVESDPNYYGKQATNVHTSVEIQPSYSYEIKQTEHGYKTIYPGSHDHSQNYGDHNVEPEPVPVIVLRIPGAAKYASHLQVLLQQYLEARAAQFIQTLQEQEAHGIDTSQQIHEQEHNVNAYGALHVLPYSQTSAYVPAQMFIQPYFSQPLPNSYASAHIAQPVDIGDHVVATPAPSKYYLPSAHSDESQPIDVGDHVVATPAPSKYYLPSAHSDESQPIDVGDHVVATPAPSKYYLPSAHSDESIHQHSGVVQQTSYEYHNIHDEQQHNTHSNEKVIYGQPHHEQGSGHNDLLTTENFPDDKHTQVIFKTSTEHPYHLSKQYLPQTQVTSYRAPLVYHKLEEEFYNPHNEQSDTYPTNADGYDAGGYDENAQHIVSQTPSYPSTVAITPHNYHADLAQQVQNHNNVGYHDYGYSTESYEDNNLYKRNSNRKRQSLQNRDDQVKKFKRLAKRMRSRQNVAAKQTNTEQVQV